MTADTPPHGLATRLSHAGRAGTKVHGFVNPPVHRGSTVLYENMAQRSAHMRRRARPRTTRWKT